MWPGPQEERSDRAPLTNPQLLALVWLVGASGVLLLYLGSKLTFFLDDWTFLVYRPDFDLDTVMAPHGEHIVVLPVLIYKALLATFGMDSAFPFRVVAIGLFLLSSVLLFVLLRRRVGAWPALVGTAIVLFLGAAWEDLLWPFQMGYFGCMASGLGGLLALERGDRRGDLAAAALFGLAIVFSSLGLAFAVGAAVVVLLGPDRWRRLHVFLVPAAVYAAWYLGWGHDAESALSAHNVAKTPIYVLDSVGASIASLLGLANYSIVGDSSVVGWTRPLAIGAIGLAAWRLQRIGRPSRWTWAVLAIAATFWILAGFNQTPGREPESSRYQFINVVFLLLIAAELLRGVRIGRSWAIALLLLAAASLASNLQNLVNAYSDIYHPTSQVEKADLAAVEIARDTVEPTFVLSEDIADTGLIHIEAAPYLAARDRWGSPAYDQAELAASSAASRYAADKVLSAALRLRLEEVGPGALPAGGRAAPAPTGDTVAVPAGACLAVPSAGGATPVLTLPRAGVVFRAGAEPIEAIAVRRYSDSFPVNVSGLGAGGVGRLRTPADRSSQPWQIEIQTAGETTVCGLGEAGSG